MQNFHHYRAGKLHFFCPLCKYHQSTNTIHKVGFRQHAQFAIITAALTGLCWPVFGWAGAFSYFVIWAVFEFGYRLRKRQALICESCGFDPFLYKQDVQKARSALKKHWEHRIETENLFAGKKLRNYQTKGVIPKAKPAANDAGGDFGGAAFGDSSKKPVDRGFEL